MLIFCFLQIIYNFRKTIKERQKLNKRKIIINSSLVLLLGMSLYFLGSPIPPNPNNIPSISSCTIWLLLPYVVASLRQCMTPRGSARSGLRLSGSFGTNNNDFIKLCHSSSKKASIKQKEHPTQGACQSERLRLLERLVQGDVAVKRCDASVTASPNSLERNSSQVVYERSWVIPLPAQSLFQTDKAVVADNQMVKHLNV